MAINADNSKCLTERARALALEHGDNVDFFFAVKDEDDLWHYSMNISDVDSMILSNLMLTRAIEAKKKEQQELDGEDESYGS